MKKIICLFQFISLSFFAQVTIKGHLFDAEKNTGIPFASIGNIKTNMAVLSDENGVFRLVMMHSNLTDTLKFYAIGYKELLMPLSQLKQTKAMRLN